MCIEYTCVLIVLFMLNHFLCEIILHYTYFSKGHNVETTLVYPFSALWQTFTLPSKEKISEQSNVM